MQWSSCPRYTHAELLTHTHTHKYTTPLQGTVKATTTVCVRVCVQVCGGITTPDWCNPFKMTLISSDSSPAACGAVQDVQTVNQWQSDPLHNFSVRPCNKQQDDRTARENGNNIYLTFSTIFTVIITQKEASSNVFQPEFLLSGIRSSQLRSWADGDDKT